MLRDPWPHQQHGLDQLRESVLRGCRRTMLQAPCGAGKTGLAAMIIGGARRKSKRVLFCVPFLSLVDQTVAAFVEVGGLDPSDIGVIQGRHELTDWSRPVQIASIQTLMRRSLPPADLVLIDEAHVWFDFVGRWMAMPEWATVPFIGLSATPWKRGLGRHYAELLVVTTTADLIRNGFLSPFNVYAPNHPDLSRVSTARGDFHEGELAAAMNTPALVADVVENWLRRGENRPTLCFAVDRAHAAALQAQFQQAGVPTGYIDCNIEGADRQPILEQFRRGEIRVICNVATMTTGVDLDVRCIILARPTQSEMLFVQIIGRGLRIAPGKDDCLIFDHSDTHQRLGFVTDVHHAALSTGAERPKPKPRERSKLRECGNKACGFIMPAKWSVCPACHFKPERRCEVVVEDGELIAFGTERATSAKATRLEQQRWFSALVRTGADRSYKPGWAAAKFRDRFGHWPRGLEERHGPVDTDVRNWLKSEQIRFAKRRVA